MDLPEDIARRIAEIVARNIASGRAQRVMKVWNYGGVGAEGQQAVTDGHAEEPLRAYQERVMAIYLREHARVEALAQGDRGAWEALFQSLRHRAYCMLLRMGMSVEQAENEAGDFAQQACEIIFQQRFPFDVAFDAWATLILKRLILQHRTRSRDLADRVPCLVSLDLLDGDRGEISLYEFLANPLGVSPFDRVEVQERLLQAIGQLRSQAQQQVIIDTFFYELDDETIAQRLGKTRSAIQLLRHRALKRLRSILGVDSGER